MIIILKEKITSALKINAKILKFCQIRFVKFFEKYLNPCLNKFFTVVLSKDFITLNNFLLERIHDIFDILIYNF